MWIERKIITLFNDINGRFNRINGIEINTKLTLIINEIKLINIE